ncbi:adenosine deaminase [Actinocatenispora thailandica]|uniref:Adenosine deaminase n=1 Tax=Actinocatenispora thailandica TaxID=227318 RepID=A0A7R7DNW2_9ACTN|nr:adenosine deaminase [Actinocatenispora thailandica]BCJ35199.1 adenosine deaminase [Actinocatenispora thailandica]
MSTLTRLPKAELHVHLESTIRRDTLRELAARNGRPLPDDTSGRRFDGFRAFGDHGAAVRACLVTATDFRRVAVEFCADAVGQGLRYAEITFTAAAHEERLDAPGMPLAAVLDGLAEGHDRYGLVTRVILDHSRRRGVERLRRTVALARSHAPAVVAIGLAGDEAYPLAPFATVLDEAADAGVALVHHAGETAGVASVAEAVRRGHAARLGHGIRILDDDPEHADLLAEVRERGVALEVCPSSNVALGVVESFAAHPLPALCAAGLAVTVNTDIPAVVGTTLSTEYRRIADAFDFGPARLAELARAGVEASFAPEPVRAALCRDIDAWAAAQPGTA